jgi:double-stranded uracil-DNA glycosylase
MEPDTAEALPDTLRAGLDIVFVGTAAGRRSASEGAYYAHPGNKFWRALHDVALTPTRLAPTEFRRLLDLGMGFTDVAKAASGMDHEIAGSRFDVAAFIAKIEHFRPRAVAFTSKKAASLALGRRTGKIVLGRQSDRLIGAIELFVLSSPSGAASAYWTLAPWRELAVWSRKG